MKRILLVLGFVLLASMLFAQADPDPAGDGALYTYTYWNMYSWQWERQLQEPPETPNRFTEQSRRGNLEKEPKELEFKKDPEQRQERSGDCDSDCNGTPDRDRDRDQDRKQLQDGSCQEE
jgi:hypothetical protein